MLNNLGAYLKSERINKGLNCHQLASLVGYKNLNKGARKIEKAEKGGRLSNELMEKISSALGLDTDKIAEAVRKDKENFEAWLNEPVPRELIIRLMAAFYLHHDIPEDIQSDEEALEYAKTVALKYGKICLVMNRRLTYWFNREDYTSKETTFNDL